MPSAASWSLLKRRLFPDSTLIGSLLFPLFTYSGIIFIVHLADGIMSYVAPVLIESVVENPLTMGIIMAFSSMIGIVCDTWFPTLFRKKRYAFFLWATIVIALFFPLTFLFLPSDVLPFLFGMAIWGVYFEFLVFSHFLFIEAFSSKQHHSFSWGVMNTLRAAAGLCAPLIASNLLHLKTELPFYFVIALLLSALMAVLIFTKVFRSPPATADPSPIVEKKYGFVHELKIWSILLKRLWPVYIFTLALFFLEAGFLTIGVLLTEEMHTYSLWGNFVLIAYLLPPLLVGGAIEPICQKYGKKRSAFVAGTLSGMLLVVGSLIAIPSVFVIMVFLSSLCCSFALPAILSTTQDYVGRAGEYHSDIIGLHNSASSLSYIIGPVVCGGIALFVGNQLTFSILGAGLIVISLIALAFSPRKIRLPQLELAEAQSQA